MVAERAWWAQPAMLDCARRRRIGLPLMPAEAGIQLFSHRQRKNQE
jgi:hypothetical protein